MANNAIEQLKSHSSGPPTSSALEIQSNVIVLSDEIGSQICLRQSQFTKFPEAGRKALPKIIY